MIGMVFLSKKLRGEEKKSQRSVSLTRRVFHSGHAGSQDELGGNKGVRSDDLETKKNESWGFLI